MHLKRQRIAGRHTLGWVAVLGALLTMVVSVSPAGAADTVAPVLAPGTFSAAPNGNNNWRITAPQTLNLSATDDVAVSKFQYSLDGGATYVDVAGHGGSVGDGQRAAVAARATRRCATARSTARATSPAARPRTRP